MKPVRLPVLLAIACALLPLFSHARLGETEKQLIERFGDPKLRAKHNIITQGKIISLGPQLHFQQGDWRITCDLIDGRCLRIQYRKPGDWTEEQIKLVLSSNDQGSQWVEISKQSVATLKREWKRTDGSIAKWSKMSDMTLTWIAYDQAKVATEERARAETSRKPKI